MRRRARNIGTRVGWKSGSLPALSVALIVAGSAIGLTPVAAQDCGNGSSIERVSVATDGTQGNGASLIPAINADGCVVAFKSFASTLVPHDLGAKEDVFVRDRNDSTTTRVTMSAIPGKEPDADTYSPTLNEDGHLVAYSSPATNILVGDFNQGADVFVYDRTNASTQVLTWVSDGRGGGGALDQPPSMSADGNLVAFASSAGDLRPLIDKNETTDVFVYDRDAGVTTLLSVVPFGTQQGRSAEGPSAGVVLSADGCVAAFYSDAPNLVPGDTNGFRDVFVRDRCAEMTERVSVSSAGDQANGASQATGFSPAISADGRYVAFSSDASNLVSDDTNGVPDIFIRDRVEGTTVRVQPAEGCTNGGGAAQTTRASTAPSLSGDGRYVAFVSLDANLVGGDTNGVADVFILDRASGLIARVLGEGDTEPNAASSFPHLSADGTSIAFQSDAGNLVPDDTNGVTDIFVAVNPFVAGGPIPGVTPLPTCTFTPTVEGEMTETPTPTATPSSEATATATPTTALTATVGMTPTQGVSPTLDPTATATPPPSITGTASMPATSTPVPSTNTPTTASTPTNTVPPNPTRTNTAPPPPGDGGGGGCSCRIDRSADAPPDFGLVPALALPLLLWTLRRRRRRKS